jgi:hypothetical protein
LVGDDKLICKFNLELQNSTKKFIIFLNEYFKPIRKLPYKEQVDIKKDSRYILLIKNHFIPFPARNNPVVIENKKVYCVAKQNPAKYSLIDFKILKHDPHKKTFQKASCIYKNMEDTIALEYKIKNLTAISVCIFILSEDGSQILNIIHDTSKANENPHNIIAIVRNPEIFKTDKIKIQLYVNGIKEIERQLRIKSLIYGYSNPLKRRK